MKSNTSNLIGALSIIAGLLAFGGGCASVRGAPVGEVLELASEGGTKPLREELRPVRGSTRLLVFALDGVGYHDLHRAIAQGRMSQLAAIMGAAEDSAAVFQHAYSAPDVLSILPSTTIPAWTSIFSGAPPAETGVPGNEWWSREDRQLYIPAPVSVSSNAQAIRLYTDGLLGRVTRAPTVFEQLELRSHVSMLQLHRGADLLQLPEIANFGDLFMKLVGDAATGSEPGGSTFRETDETSVASVLSDLDRHGVPDVQVVYFGGLDLVAHATEQPLDVQQSYLAEVVDPAIGKVVDAFREHGALDSTYVIVVSDHGHTPVLGDDRHALGMKGDDEPPAVLESAGFRVRAFEPEADADDFQAVLAYQGAMAYVYLADRPTCAAAGESCDWTRPPRLERDVLPAARAFHEANRAGTATGLSGTLDLIFARRPAGPGEISQPFEIFDGERLVPVAEYLSKHPRPDLPRLEERLRGLGVGPFGHLAGDIVLLAKSGLERPIEERFYFGEEGFYSWHGSASEQDSRIPLIVAHGSLTGVALRETVRRALGDAPSQLHVARLMEVLLSPLGAERVSSADADLRL
jgi:hypothetical protein